MSHLLKEFRGKVDLIYIDPPFDSNADYKKKIKLKGKEISNDRTAFEEKQYGDIWTNDEYLQFMFERLILLKELLSDKGSIFIHLDYRRVHHLKLICDEVFGANNFLNEVIWCYGERELTQDKFNKKHDNILFYAKNYANSNRTFNCWAIALGYSEGSVKKYNLVDEKGRKFQIRGKGGHLTGKQQLKIEDERKYPDWTYRDYFDEKKGILPRDWFSDITFENRASNDRTNYPTQKPTKLLDRLITVSSNLGDLVFDCFMGSGTTQAVAMKLGRRFIGADINLGAIQTTTKRLLKISTENKKELIGDAPMFTGFEVYNVNNYDIFRNPLEARSLLLQALEVEPFESSSVYDGEKDGRMIKIMPENVNRIATKADIDGFISNLPYKVFERKKEENPTEAVLKLTIVCMGHEADLSAAIKQALHKYKVDVEIVDILTDRKDLQFKREAEGEIAIENGKLLIKNFYPLNLLQKLSLQKENVDEWRQLVESIMVDFNYDGAVLSPTVIDSPDKNEFVKGIYDIPKNAGKIKVKITDLLSESLELDAEVK